MRFVIAFSILAFLALAVWMYFAATPTLGQLPHLLWSDPLWRASWIEDREREWKLWLVLFVGFGTCTGLLVRFLSKGRVR